MFLEIVVLVPEISACLLPYWGVYRGESGGDTHVAEDPAILCVSLVTDVPLKQNSLRMLGVQGQLSPMHKCWGVL